MKLSNQRALRRSRAEVVSSGAFYGAGRVSRMELARTYASDIDDSAETFSPSYEESAWPTSMQITDDDLSKVKRFLLFHLRTSADSAF